MKEKLIIIGAGGHAKVVIDIVDKNQYDIIGILDKDEEHLHEMVNGVEIIGSDQDAKNYFEKGVQYAFIGVGHLGHSDVRTKLFEKLKTIGFSMINIIAPGVYIADSCSLGEGNLIMPNCVINAEANIGHNNIVNTGAIIEHEVFIGNNVHLAPGTIIAGRSRVEDGTFVGAGSVIIQNLEIGKNSIIGAGSTVLSSVGDNSVAVGSPAKIIREE